MRQKMITLCDETWALAQAIPNFSEWVRARLLEHDEERQLEQEEAERFYAENGRWPRWFQ